MPGFLLSWETPLKHTDSLTELVMIFFKFHDPSCRAGRMRMKGYNILCLLMFIVFNTHVNYFGQLPALVFSVNALSADGVALLEMKSSFEVPPNVLSSWRNDSSSDVDPCRWEGVHCSTYGKVSIAAPMSIHVAGKVSFQFPFHTEVCLAVFPAQ